MSPAQNAGMPAVPQILTNNAAYFEAVAVMLRDMGYTELNLNLGCPSGTVTAKGKGSGLLREPDRLKALLDGIFSHPVLPVSVKTRIGYEQAEEWPRLLEIYRQYPFSEMIVHPRTRQEFYQGTPHREACGILKQPYIYNGDLFTAGQIADARASLPQLSGVMLGRGLVANPALAREALGGERLCREELRAFHDALLDEALQGGLPPVYALARMKEIWYYMIWLFPDSAKLCKALNKSRDLLAYRDAVSALFAQAAFDPAARFGG